MLSWSKQATEVTKNSKWKEFEEAVKQWKERENIMEAINMQGNSTSLVSASGHDDFLMSASVLFAFAGSHDRYTYSGRWPHRWQKNLHLLLASLNVVYVLTTTKPEEREDATFAETGAHKKWEQDDYICEGNICNAMSNNLFDEYHNEAMAKEIWDSLEAKYTLEDSTNNEARWIDSGAAKWKLIAWICLEVLHVVRKLAAGESEKRIESLESENEKNEKEVEIYKERIKNLESAKEKIEKEVETYREKIKNLESAKEKSEKEVEIYRERMKSLESAKEKYDGFLLKLLKSLRLTEERLVRIINNIVDNERIENYTKESDGLELDGELKVVSDELMAVTKLTKMAELKVNEYKESRKREKRGLESNVLSLTEENRIIYSLLKTALVEMEAAEKIFRRLKGNIEQKRVAILQIAESGLLQKVGFESVGTKLDSSEGEEEVVSLASTVERIMKNLNTEITQLRRSLEESRSNTENLQSLTEKQAQDIAEKMLYIKELEDREKKLAQNVEELVTKIKETEAEVGKWREACELEVEAGKREIEERDKVVAILSQELEKTKTALDISNRKLNEKEELAAAAMAAQSAADKSLQLANSTAAGLRKRVEELSKQLEEAESRDRNRRKARHICGPWGALKLSTATMKNKVKNVRRMLSKCKPWRALKLSTAKKNNKVKNERRMLPKYKKDAVKLSTATMNNRVNNAKRMLSKCKPWRALKPSTATMNNRVKNVRKMLSKSKT
ncbi:hypothetical protein FEM48_Zijuj03G0158200 [Ziziphus jujuba var. spinosa]|uniref:Uncharacterized protein n=1 Tax=Ziziphus jujuba var. spinosa TaxID=714518 RepID=A0A978VR76_ZIZJJ|nr:hypothetical protein FEM48_Zijuj03G0158200 [Ziziphus jujuba var. spinosa]